MSQINPHAIVKWSPYRTTYATILAILAVFYWVAVIAMLAFVAVYACGCATHGVPHMTTADALHVAAGEVLDWCEDENANVRKAREALERQDYTMAFELMSIAVDELRSRGEPVPREVEAWLRVSEQAVAVQVIQDAMRALSTVEGAIQ